MSTTREALLRQWHMLLLLPRHPRKTTVGELRGRLAADGFKTTTRTIQRDLLGLSGSRFPIHYDDRSKPYGWSWAKDAAPFHLPALSIGDAMVLQMLEEHLRGLLPMSTLEALSPYFNAATKCIESTFGRRRHQWLDKVRVLPANQRLIPPVVNAATQTEVFEALFGGSCLRLRYRPRGAKATVEYEVNPLAIVQRGPATYLVATIFRYTDIRLLALHRIQSATRIDRIADRPKDFDLDRYIHAGNLDFGNGEKARVKLRFFNGAGDHLHETQLCADQTISALADGTLEVTGSIPLTPQLEWWIQAFLDNAEVLEPKSLRIAIRRRLKRAAARYA